MKKQWIKLAIFISLFTLFLSSSYANDENSSPCTLSRCEWSSYELFETRNGICLTAHGIHDGATSSRFFPPVESIQRLRG